VQESEPAKSGLNSKFAASAGDIVFLNPVRYGGGHKPPEFADFDAGNLATKHHSLEGPRVYPEKLSRLIAIKQWLRTGSKDWLHTRFGSDCLSEF
jgi:hypothetical protein